MKRTSSIILSLVVIIVLIFATPLTVFAQDPGADGTATPEPTPTEEPTDTTPLLITTEGDVIEPGTEELPAETNVAYYCVVDNTTGAATCSSLYSSLSTTISAGLSSSLGSGFSLVINLLSAVTIFEDVLVDGTGISLDSFTLNAEGTSTIDNTTVLEGSLLIQNFYANTVNVTGNQDGFEIYGQLTLDNISADVNISGVYVENYYDADSGNGIDIENVYGDVTISDSETSWNAYEGIDIYNTGSVTIDNVISYHNGSDGVELYETGDVTINQLSAIYNYFDGLYLEEIYGDITVTDSNLSHNGTSGGGMGIEAFEVYGDTSLIDLTANNNSILGINLSLGGNLYLDGVEANYNWLGASLGMYMTGYDYDPANTITVMNSTFSNNDTIGLAAFGNTSDYSGGCDGICGDETGEGEYLSGDIYLQNVTANNNWIVDDETPYYGYFPSSASIYLNGFNANDGLITLNNVTANNSGNGGIYAYGYNIVGSQIQANGNMLFLGETGFPGANLFLAGDPESSISGGVITIECSQFNENHGYGAMFMTEELNLFGVQAQNNSWGDWAIMAGSGIDGREDYSNCMAAADEISEYTDIVIEVLTGEVTGTGSITNNQGLVFKLMEEMADGQKDMLARVAIPASAAAAGTTFTFTEVGEGDPAALSEGMTYVGRAFTITAVSPDGSELNNVNTYIELLFKVDPNFTAPDGTHLAIVHYNEETGEWDVLSTGFSNGYAYAYSALTGAYALVTVTD